MLATTFSGIFYVNMSVANPTTIYVDDNNTVGPWDGSIEHPYKHIQDGINATNWGDTVFVYSGIYYEQVTLDGSTNKNNVTLLGENTNRTIIDACGNTFALYIVNSNSEHISKFSLTNASSFSCSFAADGIDCYDNEISDCHVVNNLGTGLRIYSHNQNASNNRIINCDIYGNNGYGIKIETNNGSVSDNVIYHNNIFNNGQNAYDTGSNIWYNAAIKEGNWWLDYTGEDHNGDGIGDTPYNILGGSNQDLYPFMNENGWLLPPNQPPVADFTYTPNNPTNTTVIHFTDTSTDPDGTIVSWWWNFGDHYYSDLQNPIHCYYVNGEYNVTLTVTDNNGKNNTYTGYVTVQEPTPILSYTPSSYNFGNITVGQIISTTFEIWNSGTGTLSYHFDLSNYTINYVTVTPTSGDSTGEHDTITVRINTTGWEPGSSTCPIDIHSNGGSGTFTVYFNIIETPVLAYTPSSYNFGNMTAGETASTTFEIWNSGTGTLTYGVGINRTYSFIKITPSSGSSTGEHDTITVSIDTTNLTSGWYTCPIGIHSNGGSGTFTVDVNIIQLTPILSYNPVSHGFGNMYPGHTTSTSFEIWNSGTGTLIYVVGPNNPNITIPTWVTITPSSGSSTGEHDTITVNINTTNLNPGNYSDPVSISSNGGSGTFTVYVIVIQQIEVLDQQQTQYNNNFALYTTRWGGQSFKPTVSSLTRAVVFMRKAGIPPSNVVFSVRSSLTGADLVSLSKPASQIPTRNGWVEFDFSDLTVTPGSTYYLVLRTSGGSSTNCYYWGYGSKTPYTNGMQWTSANGGRKWTQFAKYDFCFKTYGFS